MGVPSSANVWALFKGKLQKRKNDVQDFFLLFKHLIEKLDPQDLEHWAVTSWAIWNAYNRFYFGKAQVQPKRILDSAVRLLRKLGAFSLLCSGDFLLYTFCFFINTKFCLFHKKKFSQCYMCLRPWVSKCTAQRLKQKQTITDESHEVTRYIRTRLITKRQLLCSNMHQL